MIPGVPRRLRVQYPGAIYHVMDRGDRAERIFLDDRDRHRFVRTLGEACKKTDWLIHAYCLLSNHFHLVLETPRANLVEGMKWLLGTYTIRFNLRHKLIGHLFAGRYKSKVVSGSGDDYFRTACNYVHLNPVRAKQVRPEEPLESYRWSSYPAYLWRPEKRPTWLQVDRLFGALGIPGDTPAGRREFGRIMERLRSQAEASGQDPFTQFERDWCWGDEAFRAELLLQVSKELGENHHGPECLESALQKAERVILEELVELGWSEVDLQIRRKSDPGKVRIALRLREETTRSLQWIAARLEMGQWRSMSNHLGAARRK